MKKSCFALLALGAFGAAAHAQSSVTLYGVVDAGLGYTSGQRVVVTPGKAGRPTVYQNKPFYGFASGTWSGPRWGLKGTEDLGGGLSAIFQIESGFNIGTGQGWSGDRLFGRQAYMGLSSKQYGTLTLGRQYDPIVMYVASIGPGSFTTGVTAHPGDLDNEDNQSRVNNTILYRTPTWNGMQFGAMYGFGNQAGSVKSRNMWSVGGNYAYGPFAVGVAYLNATNNTSLPNTGAWDSSYDGSFGSSVTEGFASARDLQIIAAAATYKVGNARFGVNYGNTQYTPDGGSLFKQKETFNAVGVNAEYNFTPFLRVALGYNYARGTRIDGASAPAYNTVGSGAFYSMSKATQFYLIGGYTHATGRTLDRYGNLVDATATIGDFTSGTPSATPTQTVVRVGMRHSF